MKITKILFLIALMAMILLTSCGTANLGGVGANYSPMKNYFVRNDYSGGTHKLVIHNESDFNRVFGAAAVMGKNGQPSSINWQHQFVVALILPETNRDTQIENVRLNRIGDRLYYSYLISEGHKTGYTMRPFTALVVSRSEPTDVVFQRVTMEDLEKAGIHYNGNNTRQSNTYTPGNNSGSMKPNPRPNR